MPIGPGAQPHLATALRSLADQDFPGLTPVVVLDGATKRTEKEVMDLAERFDQSLVVRSGAPGAPRGVAAALNFGLERCETRLVARLDADDVAHSGRFAEQIAEFERDRDLVLLGSAAIMIDERGRVMGSIQPATDPVKLRRRLRWRNQFVHPSVMFDLAAVLEEGGYRAQAGFAEDYDLWLRLSRRGSVRNLPRAWISYRMHPGQVTRTARTQDLGALLEARNLGYRGQPLRNLIAHKAWEVAQKRRGRLGARAA